MCAKTAKREQQRERRALHIDVLSFARPSKPHHVLFDEGSIDKTRANEKEEFTFEAVFSHRKYCCSRGCALPDWV